MSQEKPFFERNLTDCERQTTRWLLEHGNADAGAYLTQLTDSTVIGVCGCGCTSIDFAVNGKAPEPGGMHILSDYYWVNDQKQCGGIFAFAIAGQLAGLEVYSMDGECDASALPDLGLLVPLPSAENAG